MALKFSDKVKKAVKAAASEGSVRSAQRSIALALGKGGKTFSRDTLWEGMQAFRLDSYESVVANLTQNMKKDSTLFSGDYKKGWKLTKAGEEAAKLVSNGTAATVAALRELSGKGKTTKKKTTKKKAGKKKSTKKKAGKKKAGKKKSTSPTKARSKRRRSKTAQALANAS